MSLTGGYYLGTPGNLGPAFGNPIIRQPAGIGTDQQGPQPVGPAFPSGGANPERPGPDSVTAPAPPNYSFAPQTVSPTGPSQGFDPQFLQNLTTYIGGLFSRPQGNLSFNPLGNLSDVPSQQLGYGNAPLFGLPNTLLQDALNNSLSLGAPTNSGATPSTTGLPTIFGGGGGGVGGQSNPVDLQGDPFQIKYPNQNFGGLFV